MPKGTTEVEEVNFENLDFLNEDTVLLPDTNKTEPEKTVFSPNTVDTSFLDPDQIAADKKKEEQTSSTAATVDDLAKNREDAADLSFLEEKIDDLPDDATPNKSFVLSVKELIESGDLLPFDDGKNIEDYTAEDFRALLQANIQEKEKELVEKIPNDFYEALPSEAKAVAEYAASGGKDWKAFFSALAQTEESKTLDPNSERDAEIIVRNYYLAKKVLTEDEIDAEIADLKDSERLTSKANLFKPKLDGMAEELVQEKVRIQKLKQEKQKEQSQIYVKSVHRALDVEKLNGIPLDPKTQERLYAGLVQPTYTNSQGNATNALGHYLEKYQFVEPNHALIAEALWLLEDPEGYRNKLKDLGRNESNDSTLRKLKQEQTATIRGNGGTSDAGPDPGKRTIKRDAPKRSFFERE